MSSRPKRRGTGWRTGMALLLSLLAASLGPASALGSGTASAQGPLIYRGGPVMHSVTVHSIYWAPPGHDFKAGYRALIDRFWNDVALAGGRSANDFALLSQYGDARGPATLRMRYAAVIADQTSYPGNGCSLPDAGVCLTDAQVQGEIARVVSQAGLPRGLTDTYVMFTPQGVAACGYAAGCTYHGYCAYHSWIGARSSPTLYAVVPYGDVPGCRGPAVPNGNPADQTIDNAAHEYAETLSDPLANAWIDEFGNEPFDKCLNYYGPALGRTRYGAFNAVIGHGVYELQGGWSNRHGRCVAALGEFSISRSAARSASPATFDAGASAGPGGRISAFTWRFGDGTSGRGVRITHRFPHAGSYEVFLTVSAEGRAVTSRRTITVLPALPRITVATRSLAAVLSGGLALSLAGEGPARLTLSLLERGHAAIRLTAAELRLDPRASRRIRIRFAPRQRLQLQSTRNPTLLLSLAERLGSASAGLAQTTLVLR